MSAATVNDVVACSAIQGVPAPSAHEDVVAAHPLEHVVSNIAAQLVVQVVADQIRPGVAQFAEVFYIVRGLQGRPGGELAGNFSAKKGHSAGIGDVGLNGVDAVVECLHHGISCRIDQVGVIAGAASKHVVVCCPGEGVVCISAQCKDANRFTGVGDAAFSRALPVGVAGRDCDGLADLRFGQGQGAGGGAGDVDTGCFPLVADGAQAVQVSQGVAGCEGLVLCGSAADTDRSSGQVIDVSHGDRKVTGGCRVQAITGADTYCHIAYVSIARRATEVAVAGVKAQPSRQCRTISPCGAIYQCVAVGVSKGVVGHLKTET